MLQLETARHHYGPRQPRTAGFVFIALLHTAAIYAFATALHLVPKPSIPLPLVVTNVAPEERDRTDPPPERPVIEEVKPPVVVAPVVEVQLDPAPSPTAIVLPPAPPVTLPRPADPPVTVTPVRGIMSTHTTPEYPILSRRLGEEGTVRLSLSIGADGMVSEASVVRSSGFKRLDEAAVDWVKRYWRYQAAMRGVTPVASRAEASLQFRLQGR
jgi:protein TonB